MIHTSQDREEQEQTSPVEPDRLKSAARAAARWDVVLRPSTRSMFALRVQETRRELRLLEAELAAMQSRGALDSPAAEALREVRENPRMLRSAMAGMADAAKTIPQLPRVALAAGGEEPRVAQVARLYFDASDEPFSAEPFCAFVRAVQEHEPLTVDELWNVPAFLRFMIVERMVKAARAAIESGTGSGTSQAAGEIFTSLKSLRAVNDAEWTVLIEPLIVLDEALWQDPARAYAEMDFESREVYRRRIAFVARHSDCTECGVAQKALELARKAAQSPVENDRRQRKREHVGYYLLDRGLPRLAQHCGYHPPMAERMRVFVRANADYFYITAIEVITIFFVAALMLAPLPRYTFLDCLICALLLALPVSQCAVDLVNNVVTSGLDPQTMPKLNFRLGIPQEFTTLVAVPTLLIHEKQVRGLVTDLEVRYLANRDQHLHFALVTDLPDSTTKPRDRDGHPLVDLAVRLIDELNAKYGARGQGGFLLLHRHRIFNRKQGVWMGWERKRGKLLDLNKLLVGDFDAFPIKAGRPEVLAQIRYVLTLDSDTQLPRGTAARLIGAMAHPLNQAIIDPARRIVTEGYGILQPRIGVAVHSAARSRLASIFSGQTGFDIYTRAISDAYQELYGEGIFTGKGLYEVRTFHSVLDRRFPRNALLSHDLIEGAYVRAGLATDVELIDDYPSHFSAYTRRKHRWLRGDWQITRWLFSRVPEEDGRRVSNPISEISRWKILDNLRRSLVEPMTFVLFVAGWLGAPGGPRYWTQVALFLLFFPTIVQLAFGLTRAIASGRKGAVSEVWKGFTQALLMCVLNLVFLPHQALLAFDAIIRSLVRAFVTGERLLEWETAAQAETQSTQRAAVDRYLAMSPLVAGAIGVLVYAAHPHGKHILWAAPVLVLWGLVDGFADWLNATPREENRRLSARDEEFLIGHALRTWRFFCEFGGERHNYLIPDNVEEQGRVEAARVSPTNLGLVLNARLAACRFGFLTLPELVTLTDRTLATVGRMEKYRGHLYNWYSTETLEPLGTRMVSSVDSGNLVASLYTQQAGIMDLAREPLLSPELFAGLRSFLHMAPFDGRRVSWRHRPSMPREKAPVSAWIEWLVRAAGELPESERHEAMDEDARWWTAEAERRIAQILSLLCDAMPWLLPEHAALRGMPELEIDEQASELSIDEAIPFAEGLAARLEQNWERIAKDERRLAAALQLRESLAAAMRNLRELAASVRAVAEKLERVADETEFGFLVHPGRRMLSIGYDADARNLHDACYDLLASEARIATFLAVARGELPQESWFRLSRDHTLAFDRLILLSWTGTMFEYLMPALWMRSYPHTLIANTSKSCVDVQRIFGDRLNVPWGISESGFAQKDGAGHYQYQAYGVPQIALKFDAEFGPVISPYSTFLALGIDSIAALRNLHRMASEGWGGAYGFYESIDFTSAHEKGEPVREWMAHHQGMSLLAILNLLRENAMQEWFHAVPLVQSTELVLHEMPMSKAVLRAKLRDFPDTRPHAAAA